ncbi:MAG: fasciclin domain-containing protein [Chromatiales bacterium]|nr:fasciclin domain-containing protein [Chromatiales bacterium]
MPLPPPLRRTLPLAPAPRAGLLAIALAASAAVASAAPSPAGQDADWMTLAVTTGYMPTLGRAVAAAGLVADLAGPGPFTLFAPTEAAFARLPPGVLEELLQPENQPRLRALLLGHLVAGDRPAASLGNGASLDALNGGTLAVSAGPGGLTVNGARVTSVDVGTRNAVIHFIDQVLIPPG